MKSLRPILFSVVSILSCGFSLHGQERNAKVDGSTLTARMHGERVLSQKDAPLLNPICRFEEQPWFEISNLRPGKTLNDALVLDFAFAGELTRATLHIVVLTNGTRHKFPINPTLLRNRQGEFACSYNVINDKTPFGANLEAYVELTDSDYDANRSRSKYASSNITEPIYFKVSKSATLGKVSQPTLAREIRPDELRVYLARQKKYGPPGEPPANYKVVNPALTLVPGTPVLACFEGDWLEAEVLGVTDAMKVVIHWPRFGHSGNLAYERSHIAVNAETAAQLRSNPQAFRPSVELATNSLQPPEKGFVVLPESAKLFPGVPLRIGRDDYTVAFLTGEQVSTFYDRHPSHIYEYSRSHYCISEEVLEELKKSGAEKTFAERLKQLQTTSSLARTSPSSISASRPLGRYPIRLPLPDNHNKVDEKANLKPGTKCLVCWGNQWSPVTVTQALSDGAVEVKWEGWGSVEKLSRAEMIISDAELKKLGGKKPASKPAKQDQPEKSDASTKFKIVLTDVGKNKTQVIRGVMKITELDLKSAGEMITELPIELASNLTDAEAKDWQSKFEKAGAKVSIEAVD